MQLHRSGKHSVATDRVNIAYGHLQRGEAGRRRREKMVRWRDKEMKQKWKEREGEGEAEENW